MGAHLKITLGMRIEVQQILWMGFNKHEMSAQKAPMARWHHCVMGVETMEFYIFNIR